MLEGTLDSFTVPDIFQLLALTKKSGCLQLTDDRSEGRVWFDGGQVYYALASGGRLALGKRLVGAGLVDAAQLQTALEQQRDQRGVRLGRILVEQGAIDEPTLETFVREQIQDAVFDLMRWNQGAFAFESPSPIDESIGLTVSVENLIMEGSRRLEEWDTVRKKIPGPNAVVAMAPAPSESGVEVNLKPEEWRLLSLVDGRRTVGDLVEVTGQGEFMTCKLLFGLVGAGLLEVRDPEVHGPPSIHALLQQVELLRQLEAGVETETRAESDLVPPPAPATEPEDTVDEAQSADVAELEAEPGPDSRPDPAAETDEADEEISAELEGMLDEAGEVDAEGDAEVDEAPSASPPAARRHESVTREDGRRITTDPALNTDLIDRLIEGVKGL